MDGQILLAAFTRISQQVERVGAKAAAADLKRELAAGPSTGEY
jgi:hypothetical protein